MCEHYAEIKSDYLYRGDVLKAVPFVSLDANEVYVESPEEVNQPSFQRASFIAEKSVVKIDYPVTCAAKLERLPGVVMLRTCEGNKRHSGLKIPPVILMAPIRPFTAFPIDKTTNKPFHELVLTGFPQDSEEEPGECYRFMVLMSCEEHGLPDGGLVCFREAQPVPIRHLLGLEKITRLAIPTVGVLDFRLSMYMQQQDDDNDKDAAPVEADSPIVAAFKKRLAKQQERQVKA
ncbi:MAG: hypothetical protein ACR2IV_19095 [Bryobacteraceae bacterium]